MTRKGNDPRRLNSSARDKIKKRLIAEGRPCALCGGYIDYDKPHGSADSFEIDEIVPVSRYWEGGYLSAKACALDYSNLQPAHRLCNQRRGNMTMREWEVFKRTGIRPNGKRSKRGRPKPPPKSKPLIAKPIEHSREW